MAVSERPYQMPAGAERIFTELDSGAGRADQRGVVAINLKNLKGLEWALASLFGSHVQYKGETYVVKVSGNSFKNFMTRNDLQGATLSDLSKLGQNAVIAAAKDRGKGYEKGQKQAIETKMEKIAGKMKEQEGQIKLRLNEFINILETLKLSINKDDPVIKELKTDKEGKCIFTKKGFAELLSKCIGNKTYTGKEAQFAAAIKDFAKTGDSAKATKAIETVLVPEASPPEGKPVETHAEVQKTIQGWLQKGTVFAGMQLKTEEFFTEGKDGRMVMATLRFPTEFNAGHVPRFDTGKLNPVIDQLVNGRWHDAKATFNALSMAEKAYAISQAAQKIGTEGALAKSAHTSIEHATGQLVSHFITTSICGRSREGNITGVEAGEIKALLAYMEHDPVCQNTKIRSDRQTWQTVREAFMERVERQLGQYQRHLSRAEKPVLSEVVHSLVLSAKEFGINDKQFQEATVSKLRTEGKISDISKLDTKAKERALENIHRVIDNFEQDFAATEIEKNHLGRLSYIVGELDINDCVIGFQAEPALKASFLREIFKKVTPDFDAIRQEIQSNANMELDEKDDAYALLKLLEEKQVPTEGAVVTAANQQAKSIIGDWAKTPYSWSVSFFERPKVEEPVQPTTPSPATAEPLQPKAAAMPSDLTGVTMEEINFSDGEDDLYRETFNNIKRGYEVIVRSFSPHEAFGLLYQLVAREGSPMKGMKSRLETNLTVEAREQIRQAAGNRDFIAFLKKRGIDSEQMTRALERYRSLKK